MKNTNCCEILRKFWKFLIKLQQKIEFLTIFWKVVAKNGAFGSNIIFLQQFFSISAEERSLCTPGQGIWFDRDIFLIIVKWRKWEKPFYNYQIYIRVKYANSSLAPSHNKLHAVRDECFQRQNWFRPFWRVGTPCGSCGPSAKKAQQAKSFNSRMRIFPQKWQISLLTSHRKFTPCRDLYSVSVSIWIKF